jgi:hypothetical protein
MKKLVNLLLLFTFVLGMSAVGLAQAPFYDRREHRQRARIRHGIRAGEITRREAVRLRASQGVIRAYERRAERDGRLTRRERNHLDRLLDRSSRRIYRQSHDNQER